MNTWLKNLGLDRPELRAWAMYDWANSAMVCTIITAVFPIYYSSVACGGVMKEEGATRWYAIATTVGMVIIAVISPLLGTMADFNGRKKRMLGGFLTLGVGSVAAMFFIYKGNWILASILFILANIGANGSFVFYDALLPHIARKDEVDRVSTAGYAVGYLGGGVLLAMNLAWVQKPEWFGLPSGENLTMAQATLPRGCRSCRWRSGGWSSRSRCSVACRSPGRPGCPSGTKPRPVRRSRSERPSPGWARRFEPYAVIARRSSCFWPS